MQRSIVRELFAMRAVSRQLSSRSGSAHSDCRHFGYSKRSCGERNGGQAGTARENGRSQNRYVSLIYINRCVKGIGSMVSFCPMVRTRCIGSGTRKSGGRLPVKKTRCRSVLQRRTRWNSKIRCGAQIPREFICSPCTFSGRAYIFRRKSDRNDALDITTEVIA